MIVTIDGPAGAGKSTIAKAVARELGFEFLDTGAMYRVVALAAKREKVSWDDKPKMLEIATRTSIEFRESRVVMDGEDVSQEIRSPAVTEVTCHMADHPQVREHLVTLQQKIASAGNFVTEGRDQGTVAFPDAACKIFLTATAEERARRRTEQLAQQGETPDFKEVLRQQVARDQGDENRSCGALIKADDAQEIVTDGMSIAEVVEILVESARQKMTG